MKRTRRTKLEMEAYRKTLVPGAGKDMPDKVKKAQKPNMELVEPIPELVDVKNYGDLVQGWVNVYKGGPGSYWLGSDIHYTIESAKKIGGHSATAKVIKQIFISFVDDGE